MLSIQCDRPITSKVFTIQPIKKFTTPNHFNSSNKSFFFYFFSFFFNKINIYLFY